ncbi:MAG: NYN domain-containing protein [Myxococcota bacterium]
MNDELNIAVFADFENIAIGVREARFKEFDVQLVVGRLLDKGRVLFKKAYADWERYSAYRRSMHEAAFELIEVPHVSYSGKNSADIHMVVDALDLCYTRPHIDTFVILSGDSDFSPLVRKLRENDKLVIGIGVKKSSSDLLIKNCDEFLYYDDLVRRRKDSKRKSRSSRSSSPRSSNGSSRSSNGHNPSSSSSGGHTPAPSNGSVSNGDDPLGSKEDALAMVLETTEALFQERDSNLWASMIKQTLKRKKPNFDESYYGYRTFSDLLNDAEQRKLLVIQRDDKSGGYVVLGFGEAA